MDVILKVLEGAKTGAKVAIKKEQFLIGRSQKCHLCVGSTAVSRKHCVIYHHSASVSIKDLGSRNGTLVNDQRITEEVEISSGDEIVVGPLRLQITVSTGINNRKRSKVKSVAEAVERAVSTGDSSIEEDDITKWLLDTKPTSRSVTETQTIQMDDTNAVSLQEALAKIEDAEENPLTSDSEVEAAEEEQSNGKSKKKEPGKLPPIVKEPSSKDSCEAATAALRNWNRRH